MHRIWISRHSSISIREQLTAQVLFGIISRRFSPSERLPSVRDLARRLKIHPNTVSAAYRSLAERGWVKRKAGSGVFVCDTEGREKLDNIDAFAHAWIEEGLSRGFSVDALSAAFTEARKDFAAHPGPRKIAVVHPDANLASILAAEMEEALGCSVAHAGADDAARLRQLKASLLLTTTSGLAAVSRLPSERHELIPLKSIDEVLAGLERPASPVLIAVVSRSETVLSWASLLLPVLGLAGSDLIQRNPERRNWQDGLAACELVAADVLAAREVPKAIRPIVLRLISDSFLREARKLVTAEKL